MTSIRVHELAKELSMSSKEVMTQLKMLGVDVKNHLSAVEQSDAERLRAMLKDQSDLGKGESPEKPHSSAPEIKAASQPGQDQAQQSPPQSAEEQRRPRRPNEEGKRPRRPGEEGRSARKPGEEKKRPVKAAEEGRRPRRPGEEGRRPPRPRPGEERRRPARPGEEGKRQESTGILAGEERVSRRLSDDRRQRSDADQVMRDHRIANPVIPSSAMDQPVKRGVPEKKKAEERDKIFGRKREMEREFRDLPKKSKQQAKEVKDTAPKHIQIPEIITVQDLAQKMSRKAGEVIKKLMDLGVMATINQEIDAETAAIVASEMGVTVEVKVEKPLTVIEDVEDDPADLKPRPPVVTVMGHVDHGKTSLLDAIRHSNVTASEAGGITQHIGAYQVDVNGQKITFLDTPGHEAFTAMRARGAQVTDIAILVVAADDGVMPQTVEAINHAKAADVPIVVAINKIDKEDANPERVKQELTEYGLVVEEWGGDTIAVPVSAKTHYNIDQLLEMVLLVAEMRELKANPNRPAMGTVIEAQLDKRRGPVATVLVAKGTLEVGDIIVAGTSFGRIRAMMDDKGKRVKKAGPSVPVEVLGLNEAPEAGERFYVVADEKLARQIVNARAAEKKLEESKKLARVSLDDLFERIKEGEVKELNIIIKADVQGSVEALRDSLLKLSTPEVRVNSIHGGVGAITESDVMLAAASNAIIIGFNVRPDANTKETAERQGVDIRLYRVIYDAIEDVKKAMSGLLEPEYKEVQLGRAEVRQVFKVPKVGAVAGCYVLNGKITRNAKVRIVRDGIVIYEGELESLKRFKDDVREVAESFECGMSIKDFHDIKEGDIIEAFIIEEVKREL